MTTGCRVMTMYDEDDGDDIVDDGGGGGGKAAKPLVWGQLGSPHLQRALIY